MMCDVRADRSLPVLLFLIGQEEIYMSRIGYTLLYTALPLSSICPFICIPIDVPDRESSGSTTGKIPGIYPPRSHEAK